MSHFTVAVIHTEDENIEDVLAPFQENNMGDCPEEYLEFNDVTEENLHDYENGTTKKIQSPQGVLESPYDDRFKNPKWDFRSDKEVLRYVYPEGYVEVEKPNKELWATFDEYMSDYCGYTKDEERGTYGYWENPEARWDWYQVGGRWKGMLRVRPGTEGGHGSASLIAGTDTEKEADPLWCDGAKIADVDWNAMKTLGDAKRAKWYDEAMQWVEDHKEGKTDDDIRNHLNWHFGLNTKEDGMFESKEEYIAKDSGFSTYSVLEDGEWKEADKMGWFGCGAVGEEKEKWNENYPDMIARWIAEKPDHIITIVDCHI